MDGTDTVETKDRFLRNVMSNAFVFIFFIAGAGVVGASSGDGGWSVGIAAAAGCASVAYVAKLVIDARSGAVRGSVDT